MSLTLPGPLVDAEWLAAQLGDPRLRVIDVTYVMPGSGRDARAEFEAKHVPGAVYFDIDDIGDPVSELPHMLPTPARFAEKVGALGIGNDDAVVAYDSYGLMSAARGWWMFRVFGHDNVAVLDGGLRAWTAAGQPLETGPAAPAPARFKAGFRPALVRSLGNISANLQSGA
ncbi:MAG: sulfurtransferase, partial [Inquilinus sp.]|nr:sulfurtransferase [Inquilinus sp.]